MVVETNQAIHFYEQKLKIQWQSTEFYRIGSTGQKLSQKKTPFLRKLKFLLRKI